MTRIRKLLYAVAAILLLLDVVFMKSSGLWAIIIVIPDPGFRVNIWNVILGLLAVAFLGVARFGIFPEGIKLAVLSAIGCLSIA